MKTWEIEKSKYIRTLETIISGISNILNMSDCSVIDDPLRKQLFEWKEDSEKLLRKLNNNEFEIAIVGLEKAGKSSFSNALIENNLLPIAEQRCTYTTTCITYKESDSAKVIFYTKEEFERDFSDKLEKMGIENSGNYSFANLTKERYKQIFQKIDLEKQKIYSNTLNLDILEALEFKQSIINYLGEMPKNFKDKALDSEEFKEFITVPAKAIAVKEIIIGSKLLEKMPNAIIYDVPGFNSPTDMHQQQTREKMKGADVIILIAKADEPSLTGEVLDVFRECDNDGTVLKDKLFVFANKADRVENIEESKEITYNEWIHKRKILEDKHKDRIFFGSSKAHLQAKGKLSVDETNNCCNALKARGLEDDGVEKIYRALVKYNETARFDVLKRRINKTKSAISVAFEEINQKYPVTGAGNISRKKL